MNNQTEINTIVDTIVWIAEERIKAGEKFQNRNAAIYAVHMDVGMRLADVMSGRERGQVKQATYIPVMGYTRATG